MNPDSIWVKLLWPLLASMAGSITALSFQPYRNMRAVEIVMSLVVSTSFAVFVGPLIVTWMYGTGPTDIRLLGGTFYLMSSGSNILIPRAIRWLTGLFGTEQGK